MVSLWCMKETSQIIFMLTRTNLVCFALTRTTHKSLNKNKSMTKTSLKEL